MLSLNAETTLNISLWPKQSMMFRSLATEILFGGATRGGKSHGVRCALIIWCLSIPKLQCTLIRKKYQDILDNHVYGPNGFIDLLLPLIEAGEAKVTQEAVTFQNGSRIVFRHCQDERQIESAQGIPSHVLFIDEATQIKERLIKTFRAWCTMPEEMKRELPAEYRGRFPRIIYTANPIGESIGFFRRHFVKARPTYSIAAVDGFRRQYIPSRVEDNPSESTIAARGRVAGMHDAATARALLEGDWDAPLGDFFDCWDEERHVIPDFDPPSYWYRFRTFDWGSADPFAVLWFAISDGEMFNQDIWVTEDGIRIKRKKQLWFPRGTKLVYREWYGCQPDNPAKGVRSRNSDIAYGIIERSDGYDKVITLTDSYPFPDRGEEGGETIAKQFEKAGVPLTLGDTSRVTGWAAMRDALIGKDYGDNQRLPMLYVQESCKYLRDYIPALPRHNLEGKRNEDAAEHGEATHITDACRLGCLATPIVSEAPTREPEIIKEHAWRHTQYQPTMEDVWERHLKKKAQSGNGRHY